MKCESEFEYVEMRQIELKFHQLMKQNQLVQEQYYRKIQEERHRAYTNQKNRLDTLQYNLSLFQNKL